MPIVTAAPLSVCAEDRAELERMAVSTVLPYRQVVQASGLLLAADGVANNEIARRCATTADTVRRWRTKFEAGGTSAVGSIAAGRGRKPEIGQDALPAGHPVTVSGRIRHTITPNLTEVLSVVEPSQIKITETQ